MSYRDKAKTHVAKRDEYNLKVDLQLELLVQALIVTGGSEQKARDALTSFRNMSHLAGYHDGVSVVYRTLADAREGKI